MRIPQFDGYIDLAVPDRITGWAILRDEPDRRVYVDILLDSVLYATLLAHLPRPDLQAAGMGDGCHGFELSFPSCLCDGAERHVVVRMAGTELYVKNSPQKLLFSIAQSASNLGEPTPAVLENAAAEWRTRMAHEARFWWNWLTTSEPMVARDRLNRLSPEREIEDSVKDLLQLPEGASARILDVGSGPLTTLGARWSGHDVEIVAVDALANQYASMLNDLEVTPPVTVQYAQAEKLTEAFAEASFDLTNAANSLDHCANPLQALREMVRVTKPAGFIRLLGHVNYAAREHYHGVRQWNISLERGRPVIWNPQSYTDVLSYLGDKVALVEAYVHNGIAVVVLRRSVSA